jgi:hypothetical protein
VIWEGGHVALHSKQAVQIAVVGDYISEEFRYIADRSLYISISTLGFSRASRDCVKRVRVVKELTSAWRYRSRKCCTPAASTLRAHLPYSDGTRLARLALPWLFPWCERTNFIPYASALKLES